jgi:hypothetical protein
MPYMPPSNVEMFTVTSMGRFVFEAVLFSSHAVGTAFSTQNPDNRWLLRIWPPNLGGVEYPPPQELVSQSLIDMRTALQNVVRGSFVRHAAGPGWHI